jgi:hypothetical protein
LVFYHFGFETTTLTFSSIFWNFFLTWHAAFFSIFCTSNILHIEDANSASLYVSNTLMKIGILYIGNLCSFPLKCVDWFSSTYAALVKLNPLKETFF